MKEKVLLFIGIIMLTSCKTSQDKVNLIINKIYDKNQKITYSIQNNTNYNYIFYLDKTDFIFSFTPKMPIPRNGLFIHVRDKKENFISSNIISYSLVNPPDWILNKDREDSILYSKYENLLKQYDSIWVWKHHNLIKNKIIINKQKNYKIKTSFNLEEKNCETCMYYNLNPKEEYTIQLIINIDSNRVKEHLLPQEIDSLRKNNIKIFHGTVYSNKVPLIVE